MSAVDDEELIGGSGERERHSTFVDFSTAPTRTLTPPMLLFLSKYNAAIIIPLTTTYIHSHTQTHRKKKDSLEVACAF